MKSVLERRIRIHSDDEAVLEKYLWTAKWHNRSVKGFIEAGRTSDSDSQRLMVKLSDALQR